MTDRLKELTREAHSPKVRTAFDESILAAARDQAKLNAQQENLKRGASTTGPIKTPWWKAWPVWAGSGSFAAVIASVLLVTGHQVEKRPTDVAVDVVATAPTAPTAPTSSTKKDIADANTQAPAELRSRSAKPAQPTPTHGVLIKERSTEVAPPANAQVVEQAVLVERANDSAGDKVVDKAADKLTKQNPKSSSTADASSPAPSPASPPAPAAAAQRPAALVIAPEQRRADSAPNVPIQAPRSVDQCINDLRLLPTERRVVSDSTWLQMGKLCKASHPGTTWPTDLGPMNAVKIDATKE